MYQNSFLFYLLWSCTYLKRRWLSVWVHSVTSIYWALIISSRAFGIEPYNRQGSSSHGAPTERRGSGVRAGLLVKGHECSLEKEWPVQMLRGGMERVGGKWDENTVIQGERVWDEARKKGKRQRRRQRQTYLSFRDTIMLLFDFLTIPCRSGSSMWYHFRCLKKKWFLAG